MPMINPHEPDDFIQQWQHAIAMTSFAPYTGAQVREKLTNLFHEFRKTLLNESVDTQVAEKIGWQLADLHHLHPEALSKSLEILATQGFEILKSTENYSPEMQTRMHQMLGSFAGGFVKHSQHVILEEQERIRSAEIAARQKIELERRMLELRNRAILRALPDHLAIVDVYAQHFEVNLIEPSLSPSPPRAAQDRDTTSIIPIDKTSEYVELFNRVLESGEIQVAYHSDVEDGYVRHFEDRIVPYIENKVMIISRDISEITNTQEAFRQTNELLEQLTRQLISAQEEERRNLARDLHDVILSQVGAIMVNLEDLQTPGIIRPMLNKLTADLRIMIDGMRPPMLLFGLYAALTELIDDLIDLTGDESMIQIDVYHDGSMLDPSGELHVYRIVQQACDNALQHGNPNLIQIYGKITSDLVDLKVKDDGTGFDISKLDLPAALAHKHFGLANMLERAELIGASLDIQSIQGEGTIVSIRWQPASNELEDIK